MVSLIPQKRLPSTKPIPALFTSAHLRMVHGTSSPQNARHLAPNTPDARAQRHICMIPTRHRSKAWWCSQEGSEGEKPRAAKSFICVRGFEAYGEATTVGTSFIYERRSGDTSNKGEALARAPPCGKCHVVAKLFHGGKRGRPRRRDQMEILRPLGKHMQCRRIWDVFR